MGRGSATNLRVIAEGVQFWTAVDGRGVGDSTGGSFGFRTSDWLAQLRFQSF